MIEVETHIKELSPGDVAVVVGYDYSYGGYMGKLRMMGLTPGTKFIVLNISWQQGEVEIILEAGIIKLFKPDANALCVEKIMNNEEYSF